MGQALTSLKKGARLYKFPSSALGRGRFVLFRLAPDENALMWWSKRRGREMLLPLSRVTGLEPFPAKEYARRGGHSKIRGHTNLKTGYWGLMVHYHSRGGGAGRPRGAQPSPRGVATLKIGCQSAEDYAMWLVGLHALVAVNAPGHLLGAGGDSAAPRPSGTPPLWLREPLSAGGPTQRPVRRARQALPKHLLTSEVGRLMAMMRKLGVEAMQSRLATMVTWKSTPTSSPSKAAIPPSSVRRAGVAAEIFQGTPATPSQDPSCSTRQSLDSQVSEESPSYSESADSPPSVPSYTSADASEYAVADSDIDLVEGEEAISARAMGDIYLWGVAGGGDGPSGKAPALLEGQSSLDAFSAACGQHHGTAIDSNGVVYTWGSGSSGQLGHGAAVAPQKPHAVKWLQEQRIQNVAAGPCSTAAISSEGRLFLWGRTHLSKSTGSPSTEGQRSNGRDDSRAGEHVGDAIAWLPTPIDLGDKVKVSCVACGPWHTAVVCRRGGLYTWGQGTFGALGHGDLKPQGRPRRVERLAGYRSVTVSAGAWHTAAIVAAPSDRWPSERCEGHLPGTPSTPTTHAGGHFWLYTWGDGSHGKLGHGDEKKRLVPEQVLALGSESIVRVACASYHTVGVGDDGKMWTWGRHSEGRLGRLTAKKEDRLTPGAVESVGKYRVLEISCGSDHTAALVESRPSLLPAVLTPAKRPAVRRFVFTWGSGRGGRCGHGDELDVATPKPVRALYTKKIFQVTCGHSFTVAICEHTTPAALETGPVRHCESCLLPYTFIRGKRTCASCRAHFCKPCAKGRGQLVDIRPLATAGRKAKPLKVCKKCAARLTG